MPNTVGLGEYEKEDLIEELRIRKNMNNEPKKDIYQERYTAHQARKAQVLHEIMMERHSDRVFDNRPVDRFELDEMMGCIQLCPTSCDRKATNAILVTDRDEKALLSGILVGGTGWIHRAPAIILIFADPIAYKAGNEIEFMPYLDGGIAIQQLYLKATSLGLKGCYCNPNIRKMNKIHFANNFGSGIFCGAYAFGYDTAIQPTTATEAAQQGALDVSRNMIIDHHTAVMRNTVADILSR